MPPTEKVPLDKRSPAERLVRKVFVSVAGFTVLAIGVVMIVTPGPGLVVIISGLAILAAEYAWARRWLRKAREGGRFLWAKVKGTESGSSRGGAEPSGTEHSGTEHAGAEPGGDHALPQSGFGNGAQSTQSPEEPGCFPKS